MGKGQSLEAQKISVQKRKIENLNIFVQDHFFTYASQVETIKAGHNSIMSIPKELCAEVANNRNLVNTLSFVDLSHNRLKSIPTAFFATGLCPSSFLTFSEPNDFALEQQPIDRSPKRND